MESEFNLLKMIYSLCESSKMKYSNHIIYYTRKNVNPKIRNILALKKCSKNYDQRKFNKHDSFAPVLENWYVGSTIELDVSWNEIQFFANLR